MLQNVTKLNTTLYFQTDKTDFVKLFIKKGTYAFISNNYAVQFGSRYSNNKTRNANCYTMQLLLR